MSTVREKIENYLGAEFLMRTPYSTQEGVFALALPAREQQI